MKKILLPLLVLLAVALSPSGTCPAQSFPARRLTVTSTAPPPALLNSNYQYRLAVTNGVAPFLWTIKTTNLPAQFAARLPAGLSLNPTNGVLSGRPAQPGISAFYVEVLDAAGHREQCPLSLGVFAAFAHVSQVDGSDSLGTGRWDAPFASIGGALRAVEGTPGAPVAILVEEGTYSGAVALLPNVSLFGGYARASFFQSRDSEEHPTILNGAGAGVTLTMADSTQLDGCSVTGGTAAGLASGALTQTVMANCRVYGNGGFDARGTGISLTSGPAIVAHSRIYRNRASYYHGTTYGGGLRVSTAAAIVRNLIYANSIDAGGPGVIGVGSGIAITSSPAPYPYVADNIIADNLLWANTRTVGAGIYCATTAVIERNILVGNKNVGVGYGGNFGGALCLEGSGSITVRDNVLFGNDGYGNGGGIYLAGAVTVANNTLAFNTAPLGGGGIFWAGGAGTIARNNLFFRNKGFDIAEGGDGSMVVENNDFFGNTSGYYLDNATTALADINQVNLLGGASANLAEDPLLVPLVTGQRGISSYDPVSGVSTVVVSNTSPLTPHQLAGLMVRLRVTQTAWFYVLDNGTNSFTVTGDISLLSQWGLEQNVVISTPGDVFEVYDFHLPANSPVINRGLANTLETQDIELESRLLDGQPDIGADEFVANSVLPILTFTQPAAASRWLPGSTNVIQWKVEAGPIAPIWRLYLENPTTGIQALELAVASVGDGHWRAAWNVPDTLINGCNYRLVLREERTNTEFRSDPFCIGLALAVERVVTWTADSLSEGYILEEALDATGPWQPVPLAPVIQSGKKLVLMDLGAAKKFYRLRRP